MQGSVILSPVHFPLPSKRMTGPASIAMIKAQLRLNFCSNISISLPLIIGIHYR